MKDTIHLGHRGEALCGAPAPILYLPDDFKRAAKEGKKVCEHCIGMSTEEKDSGLAS